GGRDAAPFELAFEARALARAHRVLRVGARAVAFHLERAHARRKRREQPVVTVAERGAPFELPAESAELCEDHGALDRVHAAADADARVVVAAALPVHADLAHRLGERGVFGENRAAVAVAAERLRREEAGAADRGKRAASPTFVSRAEALRGILDHRYAVARGDGVELVHVRRLAV